MNSQKPASPLPKLSTKVSSSPLPKLAPAPKLTAAQSSSPKVKAPSPKPTTLPKTTLKKLTMPPKLASPGRIEKPLENQEMFRIGLTGDKNTDFIVLSNLNDYDLANVCKVSKYTRELCENENFWMNRIRRFSQFSPDINAYRKELNYTWKKLYIKLVDVLEWIYSNRPIDSFFSRGGPLAARRRKVEIPQIYMNLNEFVEMQTDKFENAIKAKDFNKAREILRQDFVNPNRFFSEEGMGRTRKFQSRWNDDADKVLNIITKDERFKPLILLESSFNFKDEQINLIMKYIVHLLTWKQILDLVFEAVSNDSLATPSLYLKYAVSMGAKKSDIKEYLDNVDIISKSDDSDGHHFQKQKMKDIKKFLSKMN